MADRIQRLTAALGAFVLALALGACAADAARAGEVSPREVAGQADGAPSTALPPDPLQPERVLPAFDLSVPLDPAAAREALLQLPGTRADTRDTLLREQIACYRRFFVNRCLDDVAARERRASARLDAIEVSARQSLREEAAYARSVRESERLAEAARTAGADEARREANRQAFEARQAAAAEERARREREAPELERRAAANRAAREQREAAVAARQAQADRRESQAPANAAARAQAIEAEQRRREADQAREEARRARRREDAQRRLEAAEAQRQQVERREAAAAARRVPARQEAPAPTPAPAR